MPICTIYKQSNILTKFKTAGEDSKKVAIIRLAVPFTGIILSTRKSHEMRKKVIEREDMKELVLEKIDKIKDGERDLYL